MQNQKKKKKKMQNHPKEIYLHQSYNKNKNY